MTEVTDKAKRLSLILCGVSTGISCICLTVNPIAVYYYIFAAVNRLTSESTQMFLIIFYGISMLACIAMSIVAKVKNPKCFWASVNIIYISILLGVAALITWGFIALVVSASAV